MTLRLRVCGVGDGDCIVIELPDGRFGLVDSALAVGNKRSAALQHLCGKRLAFCCLTHPHGDHFSGMLEALQAADTKRSEFWFALSDLDVVLESLSAVNAAPGQAPRGRAAAEALQLYDLFTWIEGQSVDFSRQITGIQYIDLGSGVEVIACGPRREDWNRYRHALARQKSQGKPVSRQRANAISIALLIRYAGHIIWLHADLTAAPLRALPMRLAQSGIALTSAGVLASVLKISHHGATNGWFPTVADLFTRCQPDDVIIISAAGGKHHPNPAVHAFWEGTGKQVHETYQGKLVPPKPLLPGVPGVVAAQLARPFGSRQRKDVVVEIPASGPISVH